MAIPVPVFASELTVSSSIPVVSESGQQVNLIAKVDRRQKSPNGKGNGGDSLTGGSIAHLNFPNGTVVDVSILDSGEAVIGIPVSPEGLYIASWARSNGVWESPAEIVADQEQFISCVAAMIVDDPATFTVDGSDDLLQGLQSFNQGEPLSPESLGFYSQLAGCVEQSEYWSYLVPTLLAGDTANNPNDDGTIAHVPYDKYGPGEHTVFVVNPVPSGSCDSAEQIADGKCSLYSFETESSTIVVPELTDTQRADRDAKELASGIAYSKPTSVSQLEPVDFGLFANLAKLVGPLSLVVGVSTVFAVAVSIPSTLLEATFDENEERIARFLRKRRPHKSQPPVKNASTPKDTT